LFRKIRIVLLAQIANSAMTRSAPCTMTVFDLEGEPLLDSERNPIVENYDHRSQGRFQSKNVSDYKFYYTQRYNKKELGQDQIRRSGLLGGPGTTCPIL
jgi:hypothetical protein